MCITCASRVHHMCITCASHVRYMCITCASHVHHMCITCALHVHCALCIVHCALCIVHCASHVHYMCITCAQATRNDMELSWPAYKTQTYTYVRCIVAMISNIMFMTLIRLFPARSSKTHPGTAPSGTRHVIGQLLSLLHCLIHPLKCRSAICPMAPVQLACQLTPRGTTTGVVLQAASMI